MKTLRFPFVLLVLSVLFLTACNGGNGNGGVAPNITAFDADPETIAIGEESTLSWTVTGDPDTLEIDNGVGTVTGNSTTVSPTETTEYTLTAKNSEGDDTETVTVSVNSPSSPTPEPTAYYNFDNCDATDDSDNDNDGQLIGTLDCSTGISGQALEPRGYPEQDYIEVANNTSIADISTFSWNLWFKLTGTASMHHSGSGSECGGQSPISQPGDRTGMSVIIWCSAETNLWYVTVYNGRCCDASLRILSMDEADGVALDEWHMLSVIHSETDNRVSIYLDGELEATMEAEEFNLNPAMSDQPLYIGIDHNPQMSLQWWYPFNGLLDEIRIYDTALTDGQIQALYDANSP